MELPCLEYIWAVVFYFPDISFNHRSLKGLRGEYPYQKVLQSFVIVNADTNAS